ncbi:MAG: hypothetical protein RI575_17860 [Balneolaceae bacterium]|nr:hypothetical protein [Balneolaceae bacterium]MDR9408950.1 hypothetical protein [Balneolaceae bacterium]
MSQNQNQIDNVLSSLSFEVDDQCLQSLKGQLRGTRTDWAGFGLSRLVID